jgi:hypothetical protein
MATIIQKITAEEGELEASHIPNNVIDQPLPDQFVARWDELMPASSFEHMEIYDISSQMVWFMVVSPKYIADVCLMTFGLGEKHVDPREGWKVWQETGVMHLKVFQRITQKSL